jgi:nucleoside-diphosphate-sugar epimerase
LIIGGSGFIGSNLAKFFLEKKPQYKVYLLARNKSKLNEIYLKFILSDIDRANVDCELLYHDISLPLELNVEFDIIYFCSGNISPKIISNNPEIII